MKTAFPLLVSLLPATLAPADDTADVLSVAPAQYRCLIEKQLAMAGENRAELLGALRAVNPEHREALAVLLAHMPERDLTTLHKDFLLANVEYACKARSEMPWGKALADELFFNYVLPYANVNERRDDWRKDFYQRFANVARRCRTSGEAALLLNKEVFSQLQVTYHATKRPKPDQSPHESILAGYASCTGLSILLADACRAACVPARITGTPQWVNNGGNHTWVEIWDRQWHFVGAAEPQPLDQAGLLTAAAKADPKSREHCIYAVSFFRGETWFPMVWASENREVPADDVTLFYTARRCVSFRVVDDPGGQPVHARLSIRRGGRLVADDMVAGQAVFVLAGGLSYEVEVQRFDGGEVYKRQVRLTSEDNQLVELPIGEK